MKMCPVGTELLWTDRRTDMMKLKVAFRNFANAPKKISYTFSVIGQVTKEQCQNLTHRYKLIV